MVAEAEYPSGWKLGSIVVALVLAVFLVSLIECFGSLFANNAQFSHHLTW